MSGKRADPFSHLPEHSRERVRFKVATIKLVASRTMGYKTSVDEIVKKAGYENENEFWTAATSMTMTAPEFVTFLTGFHKTPPAPGSGIDCPLSDDSGGKGILKHDPASSDDVLRLSLWRALREARRTGQSWLIGDSQTPVEHLSLDPLAATTWLVSLPTEKGFVPAGLRAFLADTVPPPVGRKRGGRVKGGAPPKADWDIVKDAVQDRINAIGRPGRDNDDPKWRSRADVIRWVEQLLTDRRESVATSTIGGRIDRMFPGFIDRKIG